MHSKDSMVTRITLFTGVFVTLLSMVLVVLLMIAIHRYALGTLTGEVHATSARVAMKLEDGDSVTFAPSQHQAPELQVIDQHGRVVASTAALRGMPPMARLAADTGKTVVCGGDFGAGQCDLVIAAPVHRPEGNWMVYAAAPMIPIWIRPWLVALLGGSTTVFAATVTFVVNRIAASVLRPVHAVGRELDEINVNCLSRRVFAPSGGSGTGHLADTLNNTAARLEGALTQQRQFVCDATHDLRSPITAMRVEVEDALSAPEKTSVSTLGNTIMTSLDRLERIVWDLLDISKLDAGMPCRTDPIDLADLVGEECRTRHHTTKELDCHLEPGVTVLGDRLQLGRLLTNLLDNAVRHAESTITLKVHTGCEEQDSRLFPHGVAVLEVIDDGPGIEPDKRELVFQRFVRLDAACHKDAGGSGLGLSIARRIAEAASGTLRIEGSEKGARFVLRLPRC